MSAPPLPNVFRSTRTVARFSAQRTLRSKKLPLALASTLLLVFTIVASRYAATSADPARVMELGTRWGFFGLLAYLLPFLFTSGNIAEEVEGRTFVFLASRSVGRVPIVLGKYISSVGFSVATLLVGLLLLHLGVYASSPAALVDALPETGRAAGALLLLTLFYGGVCSFWGAVIPEAGGIVATLHLAILEFLFGWMPGVFRLLSMSFMARQLAGLEKGGLMVETVPTVEPLAAASMLVAATAALVIATCVAVQLSEYRFSKA